MDVLGSIASGAVGGLLGGVGTLAKDIREAIVGKESTPELLAQVQMKVMEIELQTIQAQTMINAKESEHESVFVAGWRPFVGWVGGFALAYAAIIEPFLSWGARVYGYAGAFPVIDTTITMQVLMGILGLGIMRTVDKTQGPSPKGKE